MATTSENGSGLGVKQAHLGIPEVVFVEDVEAFMKKPGNETADVVLKKLDEQYMKYKFMEVNLSQKKKRLKSQIPDIKQTLEILKHMQKKKDTTEPMETRFLLADNVYCKASVPPNDKVCLWLGVSKELYICIFENIVLQKVLEKIISFPCLHLPVMPNASGAYLTIPPDMYYFLTIPSGSMLPEGRQPSAHSKQLIDW
uniref:VHL binding protein 1 n=1 Tax=Leptobrachium leishanense TaxID=445787 RepID=A0A8C5QQR0_9ANUR